MKEDRDEKSALVCDEWSDFLEVASDLGTNSYSREKSITWFTSSDSWEEVIGFFRDMPPLGSKKETEEGIFASYR